MTLPTRPGCSCATCMRVTSSVCEKCKKSSCAHALYHGYDCNDEAAERHGTTRRYRTKNNPIGISNFVKEAK